MNEQKILPKVIAVIGCDGSGKSTLTADLFAQLSAEQPTELLYLGQSSGNIGHWIKNLPIIGASLGLFLEKKAKAAHKKEKKSPDSLTVIVIFLLSLWRTAKFRRLLKFSQRKILVITDRYPQAEVDGFYYDGTGLGKFNGETWLVRKLIKREQKLYQWMSTYLPALVIRLNIDAETAHARKPDHKLTMLADKISVIPNLHFNHANILDLDSKNPYPQVLEQALSVSRAVLKSVNNK
ncbi:MAG: hypothetical protein COB35_08460 [Gammaproteobacteria bacterium]|nr:MAG: hypothetical protein COB35_08460 [Gammaproteobacteria bacterium]